MLAICTSVTSTLEQKELMGKPYSHSDFHISEGRKYVIFGLTFTSNGTKSNVCFLQIISDYGHLISVPIFLFDIVDKKVSKYWELKIFQDKGIALWPPSFYKEFYHDDLFEGVDEIVKDFKVVKANIEAEFNYTESVLD
jgi:hypothetical protein